MRAYDEVQELSSHGQFEVALVLYVFEVGEFPKLGRAYAGFFVVYFNMWREAEADESYQ